MVSCGFIVVCPQKAVALGPDRHLHRDDHAEQLHAELDQTAAASGPDTVNTYAFLSGGGVRAINPGPELTLAQSETCFVVCKGHLANRPNLIMRVGGEGVSDAELLRLMYAKYGVDMLGRLEGQFAFCLYDSKQARVLAARDPSGSYGLVEGRTEAGSLLICCGTFLPDGAHDVTKIHPGEYKYGWHALPRPYLVGPTQQVGRVSLDHGIRRRSVDAHREGAAAHPQAIPARPGAYEGPFPTAAAAMAAAAAHGFGGRASFDVGSAPTARAERASAFGTPGNINGFGSWRQQRGPQRRASSPGGRAPLHPRTPLHGGGNPATSSGDSPERAAAAAAAANAAPGSANKHRRRPHHHHRGGRRHSHPGDGAASDDGHSVGSSGSRGTHDSAASGNGGKKAPAAKPSPRGGAASGSGGAAAAAAAKCEPRAAAAGGAARQSAALTSAMQGLAC